MQGVIFSQPVEAKKKIIQRIREVFNCYLLCTIRIEQAFSNQVTGKSSQMNEGSYLCNRLDQY